MARKQKSQGTVVHGEVAGVALQVAWILLLLALASYSYRDVPMGGASPLNDPMQNYIGPVGAYVAWAVFELFGVVGFVLPLGMAVAGILILWKGGERLWPRLVWMGGMLLSLTILADMQEGAWQNLLANKLNMASMPGGWLGLGLGRMGLQQIIGPVGTALLAVGIFLVGLFFVTQTHPAELIALLRDGFGGWREKRRERKEASRVREEEFAKTQERIERERLKTEREELKNEIMRRREEDRQQRELDRQRKEEERVAQQQQRERERVAQQQLREKERIRKAREEQMRQIEKERQEAEKKAAEEAAAAAEKARLEELERARQEEEERQARLKAEQEEKAKRLREEAEKRRQQKIAEEAAAAEKEAADAEAAAVSPPRDWALPPLSYLQPIPADAGQSRTNADELQKTIATIEDTLRQFGIESKVTRVAQGPVVTRYELLPAADVKVERIASYAGNITLALKAESTRVQAPIPGKGVVGIEVPHKNPTAVVLRQLLESPAWATSKAKLPLALGLDLGGQVLMADLAKLPHMLIAGATGMGKTVCMNSLIAGLLMTRTPEQLRLILVDPKIVEFAAYNGLPHLLTPVITDAKKVSTALQWTLKEMERRFKLFQRARVRDIDGFNKRVKATQQTLFDPDVPEAAAEAAQEASIARSLGADSAATPAGDAPADAAVATGTAPGSANAALAPAAVQMLEAGEFAPDAIASGTPGSGHSLAAQVAASENARHAASAMSRVMGEEDQDGEDPLPDTLPYIVIIVDELAELMGVAKKEIEPMIQRITQLARATGIHMILATQRPTVNIITGTIKANVPGRVAFKVAQKNDSRVILDQDGADALVPKGDMLVMTGTSKLVRAQGAWTKDEEIHAIADFWKRQGQPQFDMGLQKKMLKAGKKKHGDDEDDDEDEPSRSGGRGVDVDASDDDEELVHQVLEVIRTKKRASTSTVQRALSLGYTRAARIMDLLEERGYIGPSKGAAPRDILFDLSQPFEWEENYGVQEGDNDMDVDAFADSTGDGAMDDE